MLYNENIFLSTLKTVGVDMYGIHHIREKFKVEGVIVDINDEVILAQDMVYDESFLYSLIFTLPTDKYQYQALIETIGAEFVYIAVNGIIMKHNENSSLIGKHIDTFKGWWINWTDKR